MASHTDCSGNEETILQCPTHPTGSVSCYHYNAAGVECVGKYKSRMMSFYVIKMMSSCVLGKCCVCTSMVPSLLLLTFYICNFHLFKCLCCGHLASSRISYLPEHAPLHAGTMYWTNFTECNTACCARHKPSSNKMTIARHKPSSNKMTIGSHKPSSNKMTIGKMTIGITNYITSNK